MSIENFAQEISSTLHEDPLMSLGIAVIAGVASTGVCPCTLPVGLGVAGYIGDNSVRTSKNGYLIAFAFFVGIVTALTIFGGLAGTAGAMLTKTFGRYWALVMGVSTLLAAIIAFCGSNLKIRKLQSLRRPGIGGTFAYGFVFSLGTAAAPMLVLLSVAAANAHLVYGLLLACAFGVGRGLPFLCVGIFSNSITQLVKLSWLKRSIQIASGVVLLYLSGFFLSFAF